MWPDESKHISLDDMNRLINDAKKHGNSYFGILGGEPFLHPQLMDIFEAHPDCYFQVFTNGQLITDEVAARLRRVGNVSPLISVEGTEIVSDERRGRLNVLNKTLAGLEACRRNRLITGVATSVCQTNIDDLVTERWLRRLIDMGVHYAWFHTYRAVGPKPNPELSLTPEQIVQVRRFVVEMRSRLPIAIVDAYWDDKGEALCPMATGVSHHISPYGDIEPCPIIQFARETIHDQREHLRDHERIRRSCAISARRRRRRRGLRRAGAAGPGARSGGAARRARHHAARNGAR